MAIGVVNVSSENEALVDSLLVFADSGGYAAPLGDPLDAALDALEFGSIAEVSLSSTQYTVNLLNPSLVGVLTFSGSGFNTTGWDGIPETETDGVLDVNSVVNTIELKDSAQHTLMLFSGAISGLGTINEQFEVSAVQVGSAGLGAYLRLEGSVAVTSGDTVTTISEGTLTSVEIYARHLSHAFLLEVTGNLSVTGTITSTFSGDIEDLIYGGSVQAVTLTQIDYASDVSFQVIGQQVLVSLTQLDFTAQELLNYGDFVFPNFYDLGFVVFNGDDVLHATTASAIDVDGYAGNDSIVSSIGSDRLAGSAGNDTLIAGAGDDTLDGGTGNDSLHGGTGFDWAYYDTAGAAVKVTLVTGAVQNTLGAGFDSLAAIEAVLGTFFADNFAGNSAANALRGEVGNDTLFGASGNDTLLGGIGDDIVRGDGGDDSLDGGAGTDWAYYNGLASAVSVNLALAGAQNTVGGGSDTLAGIENVLGTSYGDTLVGDGNANYLRGEVGNDTLNGGAGNDTLLGGDSNDTLRGEAGNDSLHGGAGFDWAYYDTAGAAIKITLVTGAVQNTLGAGSDSLAAIEGVLGTAYADNLAGNSAANALRGELGNDTLLGASGNDTLLGGDGNDTVRGDGGNDSVDGGLGIDWAYYNGLGAGVSVNLALATAQSTGGGGTDTLAGVENLLGTSHPDTLTGNTQANYLRGEVGNDTLNGGAGNDTFLGGAGADRFEYSSALNASANLDRIVDFSVVDDLIALDNDVFTAFVTENVALAAAAFRSGAGVTTAGDADDRIAYNTNTGALYYDSDGAGGAAAMQFAVLNGVPALSAGDFFVIA